MTRSRVGFRLVAILWVGLHGARAAATGGPTTGPAVDDETPRPARPLPAPPAEIEGPPRRRDTAIYWIFGFGTPEGFVGFEVVHRLRDWLELAAGVGTGMAATAAEPHPSFGHATQWSVMPRLRNGDNSNALTLGGGLSGGEYTGQVSGFPCPGCDDGPSTISYPTYYTLWANIELGGEHVSRGGFAFRYYLGFAHGTMLGSPSSSARSSLDFPYLGIGLGYAF